MAEKAKATKTAPPRTPAKKKAAAASDAPKRPARKKAPASDPSVSPEERTRLVREAAYRRAEQRGFQGGNPEEDWYEAEKEVDATYGPPSKSPGRRRTKGVGTG